MTGGGEAIHYGLKKRGSLEKSRKSLQNRSKEGPGTRRKKKTEEATAVEKRLKSIPGFCRRDEGRC